MMIIFLMFRIMMIWLKDDNDVDDDDIDDDNDVDDDIIYRENLRALGSTRDLSLLERVANRPPLARPAEVYLPHNHHHDHNYHHHQSSS